MSGSASDRRRDTRYDSFLSFAGSQKLSTLGCPWARPADDMRGVVADVHERLRNFDRSPSVFFDRKELKGDRYRDDLSKAVLQLRGGGVALILLTAEYLRREWCLAELHSFLQLRKKRDNPSRASEAVVIRVVCLDTAENIKSELRNAGVMEFVGEVGTFQLQYLEASESTRAQVVNQICGHVLDYWNGNPSICLGRDLSTCVDYLRGFFVSRQEAVSVYSICLAFGFRADQWQTIDSAFTQALLHGKFTSSNVLDELSRATPHVDAKDALREFRRKWVSDNWEWSIDPAGENDICLVRFVEEALSVLENRSTSSRPEPAAVRIESLPPLAAQLVDYRIVDVFRPHLPDWQRLSDDLEASAATSLSQLKSAILPAELGGPLYTLGANIYKRLRRGFFRDAPDSSSSLRRVALTSINGEGGVGKTSTCKLLCADRDVRKRFSNGAIVWIDVGKCATEEKVKGELGKVVINCGGERSAGLIRESRRIGAAVDIALSFFSKRRILVVVDNVWETPGHCSVASWTAELSRMATFPGSAVVMTTRFASVSRSPGFHAVHLGRLDLESSDSPDWRIAENLFDKLLYESHNGQSTDCYKKNRKKALEMSCGLPIAIKTFACLVQHRMQIGDSVGSVLERIEERAAISLTDKLIGNQLRAAIGHPGLFAAMEESLAFLDEHNGPDVVSVTLPERNDGNGNDVRLFRASYADFSGRSLSSRYYALNMLPASSTRISFPILCRLWHLRDVGRVENIVLLFVNGGLGRVEKEHLGQNRSTRFLCLHDLQYEFCAALRDASGVSIDGSEAISTSNPRTVDGHALLLSSSESLVGPEEYGDEIGMGWATFIFPEGIDLPEQGLRQYLAQNLFRHMCAAVAVTDTNGVGRAVSNLLLDFRWLSGRLTEDGRASVLSDCATALAMRTCASANSSDERLAGTVRLLTDGAERSIRGLRKALMLVDDGILKEADGALAGALIQLSQSSGGSGDTCMDAEFRRKLAHSSARAVRGPWFTPVFGCSPRLALDEGHQHGVLAQAVVGNGGAVMSLAALGDGAHFVSGSADGMVRVHEIEYLRAVLELSGHTDDVNCVEIARNDGVGNTFLLFSGSYDGKVRVWEVGLDSAEVFLGKQGVVGEHSGSVRCLAVSKGGNVIAAGYTSGFVYIWKRREGDVALCFRFVTCFGCDVDGDGGKEGRDRVNGVTVSRSGDLVVAAGEAKGGIAFWSSEGSGSGEVVMRCYASGESDADSELRVGGVRHVSLSENESSVRLVFGKPAGCVVWDVASKRRLLSGVALSNFKLLRCAIFSGDDACAQDSGARCVLVSGGSDRRGRDFVSLHSPANEYTVLSTYFLPSSPRSVCFTSFGGDKRILVGADNGCVRMLDAGVSGTSDGPPGPGSESLTRDTMDPSTNIDVSDVAELDRGTTRGSAVAVMPIAGLVVVGHIQGWFSLWQAESGKFVRAFKGKTGRWVNCIEVTADEGLAVSGHGNSAGVVLVWDAATWECQFALKGHSRGVICAAITVDSRRILTVDRGGEVRAWNSQIGGAALWISKTGFTRSVRGAISPDGGFFLWASNEGDRKWRGRVFDVRTGSVIMQPGEARHSDWDQFLEELISSEAFDGEEEVPSRLCAMHEGKSVELWDVDSGQQSVDEWRISRDDQRDKRGDVRPRIVCCFRSADGRSVHVAASPSFDSGIRSIATGWIPREAGRRRRAIIACQLRLRNLPTIMHFYPADL